MPYRPLPSKLNFPELEQEIQKFWNENHIFQKSLANRQGRDPFVFFEGPPTANAAPGLHHVLSRAFKDVICRYQTMRGHFVLRKAGWDTHGLPVELQIEKKLGISGKKQIENIVEGKPKESIAKFNALCKESVWQFKEEWEKMTARMGYWVDMSDPYITYDPKYIESVWWLLRRMHEKDLIYQGHKVVPYCPRCGTALSSHEVAQGYDEVTEPSVYVKFKLKAGHKIGNFETDDRTYILSWTTTPWTLPGNLALAVGEDIEYVKVAVAGENYILAKDRLPFVIPASEPESSPDGSRVKPGMTERNAYQVIDEFKGKKLAGLEYEPLFPGAIPADQLNDKAYRVYAADFVNTEEGTGVVHTAVMYGEEDYELGEKVGLPKFHTVDEAGHFGESVPEVAGMFVKNKETEQKIFAYLQSKNLLLKTENYTHTYPFCWRCGTALLYYARTSWYIKMSKLRDLLIKNNEQIKWEPAHIKEGRFGQWLVEIKDWAISRERYWGTPLPFWRCLECNNLRVVGALSELTELDIDPHRPYIDEVVFTCEKCGGEQRRVPEVLDVWFDSGAMPYAQWHYPFENKDVIEGKIFNFGKNAIGRQFPADFIAEGHDQTRGWFYTLLAVSTALGFGPTYKSVISNGMILDEKGQKMSKSKGNIIVPQEIFDQFGADATRWYLLTMNQPGEDKLFSKTDLAVVQRRVFNIVANVYNYFATYANANNWQFSEEGWQKAQNSDNVLDRWINVRLQQLINIVTENTEDLSIFRAIRTIEEYINDLSTWYLRRSRNRTENNFFATLHHNLIWLVKTMAPFAPFFTEYIYRCLYIEGSFYAQSVHLTEWAKARDLTDSEKTLLEQMAQVRQAAELGNSIRKQEGIKVRQPLPALYVSAGDKEVAWPEGLKALLLDELNVKEFKKTDSMIWRKSGELQLDLDITLTSELQKEGDLRELERAVQALRKEAGLSVGEPAKLYFATTDDLHALLNSLNKERLAIKEVLQHKKLEAAQQAEVDLSSGKIWLGLERL